MSILNVNQIQPVGSGQTITISASDITASSATITASSVTANLTGNVTGNLTGNVTSSSTSTFSSGLNVTGGSVGIGTDSPVAGVKLHLQDTSACRIQLSTDNTGHTSSDGARLMIDSSNNFEILNRENASIEFFTNDTQRWSINSTGNLVAASSGLGIDFSATSDGSGTASSELLDDYEEGTWTPSFTGLTGPTYAIQDGSYTKIGNLIYCECRVKLSNTGTASGGALQITGFPYTSSNDIVSRLGAYSINYVGAITSENEGSLEASYLGTNSTIFSILGNGHVSKLNTILQNTTQIDLMLVYRTS